MKVKKCLGDDDEVIESNGEEAQQPPGGLEEAYKVLQDGVTSTLQTPSFPTWLLKVLDTASHKTGTCYSHQALWKRISSIRC